VRLSGWGRYPILDCRAVSPANEGELREHLKLGPVIARGNGRSYGDSALQPQATVLMHRFNHMLGFDAATGLLVCESGVLLRDVLDVFVPRGFFPPVTPGTKFVTIGGMIAADVHGKNHHQAGSFGSHVEWLDLMVEDGSIQRCSATENAALFTATIGGMGLTGIMLRAGFSLMPIETAYIRQETIAADNLAAVMDAFEDSQRWTYTVAWIDCLAAGARLGRSLLYRGEHAGRDELPAGLRDQPFTLPRGRVTRVPVDFPAAALNRWTVRAFNELYYRKGARATDPRIVDYDTYFYPLDGILEWNRIYGRRGLVQYQCVLPKTAGGEALTRLLRQIGAAGRGSFLAVLKLFGRQSGLLSFPMEGYTLALDFPVSTRTLKLLDKLDEIVLEYDGRLYLAKDARMQAATFDRGYPGAAAFRVARARSGAARVFASHQSQRLGL